ncbi:MAG TPA: RNA polymerase sigma factor [Terriglobales bacterium]|nr:RNA polymerase sigma factor [Terriglobales bacterium]
MTALTIGAMSSQQNREISEAVEQQRTRLRNFIRSRVPDPADVEDILQDVFFELVEAYRLMKPIQTLSGWLFQVARNRITDRFRKKKTEAAAEFNSVTDSDKTLTIDDLLPSPDAGPEAAYARSVLLEELMDALAELPDEQRAVFIAHEIEGRSFAELAAETGESVNTLLSRKRYAVLRLRERLETIYRDFREMR